MSTVHEKPIENTTRRNIPPLSSTVATSLLVCSDALAIMLSGFLTYDPIVVYSLESNLYISAVVFVCITTVALLNFGGMYQFKTAIRPLQRVSYILVAVAVAYLFLLAAAFSLKISGNFSRLWITAFAGTAVLALVGGRIALSMLFSILLAGDSFRRNMAVIGEGAQVDLLATAIANREALPIRISGVYSTEVFPTGHGGQTGVDKLVEAARLNQIDDVAIALPWSRDREIEDLVSQLRELPVNVYLVSDLVGFRLQPHRPPNHFGDLPIVEVVGKPMSGWDSGLKAMEDYVLGILILLVSSPLLLAIALAVKLDSPGPIIFRQKRLGFNNQQFEVLKFRTMYHQASPGDRVQQATAEDPRVTRVGRFLRRWSLDELPQILNVMNGTMALVGPRPHALDHNVEFARRMQSYFARHRVKPGITGLAQVRGYRGETDTDEKLQGRIRNDLHYVENWTLFLDLKILLQTLAICIRGTNAH